LVLLAQAGSLAGDAALREDQRDRPLKELGMSEQTVIRLTIAAVTGIAFIASPVLAAAKEPTQKAKISMGQARQIALQTYPGRIMKEELEHEGGGIGLRYSFDLRKGKQWREVGVDALTGKVLENKAERPNPKD
jgi:uncharacterized membrane protein YkoI